MKRQDLDSFFAQYKHTILSAVGIVILFASIAFMQFPFSDLQSNLLGDVEKKNHAPFDGTTLPIKKTLDWVGLTSAEYTQFRDGSLTYATAPTQKLIDLPKYDTGILSLDPADLSWNGADKTKRNTLLTFVTAYLGAYTSGSRPAIEGAGSHLAVDIRAPRGTPVYSIANGIVVKTNNGGGNGISATVLHKNVPSIDNPNRTTNYYSSYLHLDSIQVRVGDVVTKGQQLGTVGNTGLATTYHLHFQIDTADAPFVSYWPFTWSEASSAGMDFFTGVNEGLGKEKARQYTINPMKYVYQYTTHSGGNTFPQRPEPEPEPTPQQPTTPETPKPTEPIPSQPEEQKPTTPTQEKITLQVESDTTVLAGNPAQIRIIALNESGERATNFQPNSPVRIQSNGSGRLETTEVHTFNNGTAHVRYTTSEREEALIIVKYGNQETSTTISVTDKINPVAAFQLTTDNKVVTAGVPIDIKITTVDTNAQITPAALYTDAQVGTRRGSASFPKNSIKPHEFVDGVYTMEVTPLAPGDLTIIVREGAVVGNLDLEVQSSQNLQNTKDPEILPEKPVSPTPPKTTVTGSGFTDVPKNHTNYKAISYLKRMGIIEGYADGTFRPNQTVNRAEALKMILGGSGIQPKTKVIRSSFPDVDEDAWYAIWVERARDLGIVGGNPDGTFAPASSINGAEHLKIALRTNKIIPEYLYTSDLTKNPYPDVTRDAWFAKSYEYAARKNLVPTDTSGKVYPEKVMTRGAVAEIMYRLMVLQRTSASVYNDTLLIN